MNNTAYPKPDYKNPFYNCYKNGDNPVLVFTGITNGSLNQWYAVDNDRRGLNAALPSYICKCGFIVAVGETECMNCKKPRLTQR